MNPWPISPLGTKDLDFGVINYDFTSLTAGELSPLPSLETAIDTTLADFGTSIADQTLLIASMAGDVDDLGNVFNEIGSDDFESILADLSGIASAGDLLLQNFTSLFPDPSPVPPAPPQPPPPSSGPPPPSSGPPPFTGGPPSGHPVGPPTSAPANVT